MIEGLEQNILLKLCTKITPIDKSSISEEEKICLILVKLAMRNGGPGRQKTFAQGGGPPLRTKKQRI